MKLPTTMPDGKRTTKHPLLWCLENKMGERNKSDLARAMGVRPQSLYKWQAEARADRHFPLPLKRAIQAADFFGVPVTLFRDDVPMLKAA